MGFTNNVVKYYMGLLLDFQFPLWDSMYISIGTKLTLVFFQFPLWDSDFYNFAVMR